MQQLQCVAVDAAKLQMLRAASFPQLGTAAQNAKKMIGTTTNMVAERLKIDDRCIGWWAFSRISSTNI